MVLGTTCNDCLPACCIRRLLSNETAVGTDGFSGCEAVCMQSSSLPSMEMETKRSKLRVVRTCLEKLAKLGHCSSQVHYGTRDFFLVYINLLTKKGLKPSNEVNQKNVTIENCVRMLITGLM